MNLNSRAEALDLRSKVPVDCSHVNGVSQEVIDIFEQAQVREIETYRWKIQRVSRRIHCVI